MADINLLASDAAAPKKDDEKGKRAGPSDDETALHIPAQEAEPKASSGADLLSGLKDMVEGTKVPPSILNQKIEAIPSTPPPPKPKPAPPAMAVPKPLPPRPPPPPSKPPPPPPKPPNGKTGEDKGSSLRVSLITAGSTSGLTDMAIRERMRTFLLMVVLALVLDGLIYGGLLYWRSRVMQQNETLERNVQDLDGLIAEMEAKVKPARDFQQLALLAERALDNHLHWTRFLTLLEERALIDAQFGSVAISETGVATFEIQARDYASLGKQIIAFRSDPRVRSAVIGTASADFAENNLLRGARTSMTLSFNPEIFRIPKTEAAAAQ